MNNQIQFTQRLEEEVGSVPARYCWDPLLPLDFCTALVLLSLKGLSGVSKRNIYSGLFMEECSEGTDHVSASNLSHPLRSLSWK